MNTNVFVGCFTPSRKTLILCTSLTPCSPMNSRICSQLCLFRTRQQTIPLDMFKEECGVTVHFSPQKLFNLRIVISCFSFAHCIRRSPERRFFMLLGSPVKPVIVLCTRNGGREEIFSSSFTACIKRNLGTYIFWLRRETWLTCLTVFLLRLPRQRGQRDVLSHTEF